MVIWWPVVSEIFIPKIIKIWSSIFKLRSINFGVFLCFTVYNQQRRRELSGRERNYNFTTDGITSTQNFNCASKFTRSESFSSKFCLLKPFFRQEEDFSTTQNLEKRSTSLPHGFCFSWSQRHWPLTELSRSMRHSYSQFTRTTPSRLYTVEFSCVVSVNWPLDIKIPVFLFSGCSRQKKLETGGGGNFIISISAKYWKKLWYWSFCSSLCVSVYMSLRRHISITVADRRMVTM